MTDAIAESPALFPITIDLRRAPAGVVGNGALALRRFNQLAAFGATPLLFADAATAELAGAAGDRLIARRPNAADFAGLRLLYLTDLPRAEAEPLAYAARAAGLLVNVEDVPELCDFHSAALVRRGDLTIAISTGGRAPGLAARVRRYLDGLFGAEWARHLDEVAEARRRWRSEGADMATIAARTDHHIDRQGWLRTGNSPR